jgi:CheY-like chemotaxis protein
VLAGAKIYKGGAMSTILHVEDESSVRFLYKEVFEELGYEVLQASSGEEALKMLRGNRPDIIILDLKMPGMGGRGFLEKFQRLKLPIPVVISTAYPYFHGSPADLGADAYVVKSGDMADLVDTVHGLVAKSGRST